MSEFKGTRGPWQYKEATGDKYISTPMGALMSSNYPYSQSINASEYDWRLIAAAPELLHVAELLCLYMEIMTDGPDESDEQMAADILVGAANLAKYVRAKALGETE